jgi:hypothetical protein
VRGRIVADFNRFLGVVSQSVNYFFRGISLSPPLKGRLFFVSFLPAIV